MNDFSIVIVCCLSLLARISEAGSTPKYYHAPRMDARPFHEVPCGLGKDRICEYLPTGTLYLYESGTTTEIPCQMMESNGGVIFQKWYKLVDGRAYETEQEFFDFPRRNLNLRLANTTEADDGVYFCTTLWPSNGTKLEKFYKATTKPTFTYVKFFNRTTSQLSTQLSCDGFREYTDTVLIEFWKHRKTIKALPLLALILHLINMTVLMANVLLCVFKCKWLAGVKHRARDWDLIDLLLGESRM